MKWHTQGYYYPVVYIDFKNGSATFCDVLQDGKVRVYGKDEIAQQEKALNQDFSNKRMIVDGVTISAFLAVIGGIWKIGSEPKRYIYVENAPTAILN